MRVCETDSVREESCVYVSVVYVKVRRNVCVCGSNDNIVVCQSVLNGSKLVFSPVN